MEKFNIDGKEYTADELGEENVNTLKSLQWVNAEIQRAQASIAALTTARNAYARLLQAKLSNQDSEALSHQSEIAEIEDLGENIEF